MNSKERVYASINHKNPDRIPRFIWFGKETRKSLSEVMGVTSLEIDFKAGNDILQTWLSINGQMEKDVPDHTQFVDEWGITWKREGVHNMVAVNPMADMEADEIKAYKLPDPLAPERYTELEALISEYGNEYFIGADVSGSLFEPAYHLRGMENLMIDMAMDGEEIEILLDRICEITTIIAKEAVKRGVDWIWLGDDLGSQINMLMSPDMWRKFLKPRMAKIISEIRSIKSDMIIAYHSCGSMYHVIPDLIEIGINVLNPIQESAEGMNHQKIKAAYGDKLTMMCGPDTQQFLINAAPEVVMKKTRELIETLGKNGGYIFAVSHHIQPGTPTENIFAIFEELKK